MTVPSEKTLLTYANDLYDLFGQDKDIVPDHIFDLCLYVSSTPMPDIDFMRRVLEGGACMILLRSKILPRYPHPRHLPILCRQYELYRQSIFTAKFNDVEYYFWTLGALFRSIKPFDRGNAIIGHLIENHARQRHNLPWRLWPLDQRAFKYYHEEAFCKNYGSTLPT